jgi:hypothetical protein
MNPISMYPMSPLCSSYGGPGKNINDSYEYSGIHIIHVLMRLETIESGGELGHVHIISMHPTSSCCSRRISGEDINLTMEFNPI